jgi:hypothetical protein
MLDCMSKMLAKVWDSTKSHEVQAELVEAMANLEVLLPTDWNTQVRHMLVCRFIPQLDKWGSFWAQAMLTIESFHCLVKALGRSRKNLIVSFRNNYQIFDITSLEWRFEDEELANIANPSALSRCQPIDYDDATVTLLSRQATPAISLGDTTYVRLVKLYGQIDPDFETMFEKYELAMASDDFTHLNNWRYPSALLTDAEKDTLKGILPMQKQTKV